ncbi:hypothetical protein LQZ19_08720 [Treponema primitia]|uniref:hypothetical protein n=1 Tax=Treponema primitia TaxID=88058 RepID=UPI0039813282
MAKDLPGTPDKLVLDGKAFYYISDADPAHSKPKWAKNPIVHTGGTMHQMIRQDTDSTGHKIKANGDELVILKELAERPQSFTMAWYNRAGDCYRCNGQITYDTASAANGSVELTLSPDDDWTPFLG